MGSPIDLPSGQARVDELLSVPILSHGYSQCSHIATDSKRKLWSLDKIDDFCVRHAISLERYMHADLGIFISVLLSTGTQAWQVVGRQASLIVVVGSIEPLAPRQSATLRLVRVGFAGDLRVAKWSLFLFVHLTATLGDVTSHRNGSIFRSGLGREAKV